MFWVTRKAVCSVRTRPFVHSTPQRYNPWLHWLASKVSLADWSPGRFQTLGGPIFFLKPSTPCACISQHCCSGSLKHYSLPPFPSLGDPEWWGILVLWPWLLPVAVKSRSECQLPCLLGNAQVFWVSGKSMKQTADRAMMWVRGQSLVSGCHTFSGEGGIQAGFLESSMRLASTGRVKS